MVRALETAMKKRDEVTNLVKLVGEILTKVTGKFPVEVNAM